MSPSDSFREMLRRVINPSQLQLYGLIEGRMRLQIVAGIAHTPTIDDAGRVHCVTNAVFRAVGDNWQTESAGDLTLSGTINDGLLRETPQGRLVIQFPLPEHETVAVFFPENDLNVHEPHGTSLVISRMRLDQIAMRARPPARSGIEAERPPDDD